MVWRARSEKRDPNAKPTNPPAKTAAMFSSVPVNPPPPGYSFAVVDIVCGRPAEAVSPALLFPGAKAEVGDPGWGSLFRHRRIDAGATVPDEDQDEAQG
jgi:hypothetical protein